ncbi:Cu(I)/Ag(I) efflux system protein CusF [Phenylobacterium haematophilum]|uniref:Cu(I)/Ag(I) efflux system protein CusF n=1 Tax=Phenylobacterium haematophilum TaxID=98513 RepID=A0A839ZVQ7_9CAUL|nr:copper-binding protein [Phenylobacterium haematophilum]MBB3890144.1 Cu(I)/Ag(I) efflux system protein CusF [Phenylobacterium haematophilum]
MKTLLLAIAALGVSATGALAHGQDHSEHAGHAAPAAAGSVEGTGVVKKIDAKTGSVTIAHDPIKALNWPAMTMPFKVADKVLLAKVKVGAKVRFDLSGQTITAIRPQ